MSSSSSSSSSNFLTVPSTSPRKPLPEIKEKDYASLLTRIMFTNKINNDDWIYIRMFRDSNSRYFLETAIKTETATATATESDQYGYIYYETAKCYEFGISYKKDLVKAVEFYEKAIEKQNVYAMSELALLYYEGTKIEKNIAKAYSLHKRAAELGDAYAKEVLQTSYKVSDNKDNK